MDSALQDAELELWRDNLDGALRLLRDAYARTADPHYASRVVEIRSWMRHLATPNSYAAAYERYYRQRKTGLRFKILERNLRILLGRKTRKTVCRIAEYPEYKLLEGEIVKHRPTRVLDAGCGEGRIALTLGDRFPAIRLTAVEVSATNVRIARRLNRYPNVTFAHGLVENVVRDRPAGSFDLIYSIAVLEHVIDVDAFVGALERTLQPGGRFCFLVPMNELKAVGEVPAFHPPDDVAGHVRVFTEHGLRRQFGGRPNFALTKIPGRWRHGRYPATIRPVEYGAFFVAFSVP